jgi:kynurenine formamidase
MDPHPQAQSIDQLPLEMFYIEGICLDLRHIPAKGNIEIPDLEAAVRKDQLAIKAGDAVLLCTGHYQRTYQRPEFLTDFPGLTRESATWLGNQQIGLFGVEAVSPGTPGANNTAVHRVCADLHFTHIENLCNLEVLLGQGRFRFIAFPLKIRGGSGSPVRAVAVLES